MCGGVVIGCPVICLHDVWVPASDLGCVPPVSSTTCCRTSVKINDPHHLIFILTDTCHESIHDCACLGCVLMPHDTTEDVALGTVVGQQFEFLFKTLKCAHWFRGCFCLRLFSLHLLLLFLGHYGPFLCSEPAHFLTSKLGQACVSSALSASCSIGNGIDAQHIQLRHKVVTAGP